MKHRSLHIIAQRIYDNWINISPYAQPYIDAMYSLNTIDDTYIHESARSIVQYFLANAQTWRGPIAREIKQELKEMLK